MKILFLNFNKINLTTKTQVKIVFTKEILVLRFSITIKVIFKRLPKIYQIIDIKEFKIIKVNILINSLQVNMILIKIHLVNLILIKVKANISTILNKILVNNNSTLIYPINYKILIKNIFKIKFKIKILYLFKIQIKNFTKIVIIINNKSNNINNNINNIKINNNKINNNTNYNLHFHNKGKTK